MNRLSLSQVIFALLSVKTTWFVCVFLDNWKHFRSCRHVMLCSQTGEIGKKRWEEVGIALPAKGLSWLWTGTSLAASRFLIVLLIYLLSWFLGEEKHRFHVIVGSFMTDWNFPSDVLWFRVSELLSLCNVCSDMDFFGKMFAVTLSS